MDTRAGFTKLARGKACAKHSLRVTLFQTAQELEPSNAVCCFALVCLLELDYLRYDATRGRCDGHDVGRIDESQAEALVCARLKVKFRLDSLACIAYLASCDGFMDVEWRHRRTEKIV